MPKKVYIRTFGCQMNEHDSQKMKLLLASCGYEPLDTPEKADLILFNTCTVREKAHNKAMSEIGRAKVFKVNNPNMLIGVCGCVAQEVRESLFERYPHVDILFGPDQINTLPRLLLEVGSKGRASALDLMDDPGGYAFVSETPKEGLAPPSAFVTIMKGCNCACSYCIVPSVRGREVSRPVAEIIDEVKRLAGAGTKEVVLLGQNVNAYSSLVARRSPALSVAEGSLACLSNKNEFAKLIRKIADETDIRRIRFTSPHPKDVDDELIREYAENEKLMPHIHLPVQAGSNEVLKKMRRGYTRERYLEIAFALLGTRKHFAITTDIIVGFCSETEKQYEETIDLMKRVKFDSAFAFKYSPRPGTYAAEKLKDDVPPDEKDRRLGNVLSLQREMSRAKNSVLVGAGSMALATGSDKMGRGLITGRLPDNRLIHFSGNAKLIGSIVPVKISGVNENSLKGETIQ